jgi:transposase
MGDEITYGFPERDRRTGIDPLWLKQQLLGGVSIAEISRKSGYSRQAIYNNIKRYRLRTPKRTDIDPGWLRAQKELGRSDREIAAELGVHLQTIGKIRSKHNIQTSVKSPLNNRKRVNFDAQWLAEQKDNGRSDREIAEEIGCSPGTIYTKRKFLGIGQNYHRKYNSYRPDASRS